MSGRPSRSSAPSRCAIAIASLLFGISFISGIAIGMTMNHGQQPQYSRNLEEQVGSGIDEALGITPEIAALIRADLGKRDAPKWDRPLKKHYKSVSLLQEAFVRFHRLCFHLRMCPLTSWGRGRALEPNEKTPQWMRLAAERGKSSSRYKSYHAGPSVLTRFAWNEFLRQNEDIVPHAATCIGWDNTEYVDMLPGCEQNNTWSLVYSAGSKVIVDHKHHTILANMDVLAESNDASIIGKFDLVVCNYVFEHVSRPFLGVVALFKLLKPSGLLFFAVPFNEQYHLVPGDFYRYTFDGARELLISAGFKIIQTRKLGDSEIASGYMLGFGVFDFDENHLNAKLLQSVENPLGKSYRYARLSESLYMGTFIVARKPE